MSSVVMTLSVHLCIAFQNHVSCPNFMIIISTSLRLILLDSAHTKILMVVQAYKVVIEYNKMMKISPMVQKWLSHGWMHTWNVNVAPFDEKHQSIFQSSP